MPAFIEIVERKKKDNEEKERRTKPRWTTARNGSRNDTDSASTASVIALSPHGRPVGLGLAASAIFGYARLFSREDTPATQVHVKHPKERWENPHG